jgi:Uma2 family endonuclease
MATTKVLVTPEQYLAMHFEREPELVHGELVERSLPTFPHGNLQLEMGSRLRALQSSHQVFAGVEVRVRLAADLIRIPDIALWTGLPEKMPTAPPLLVVEVSSPDDRLHDLLQRFEDFRAWGVRHMWLVEPELKKLYIYDRGSLTEVARLELPEFDFAVSAGELFG